MTSTRVRVCVCVCAHAYHQDIHRNERDALWNVNGEVVGQPLRSKEEEEEGCQRLGSDKIQAVEAVAVVEGRSVVTPLEAGMWTARHRLSCDVRFRLGTDR